MRSLLFRISLTIILPLLIGAFIYMYGRTGKAQFLQWAGIQNKKIISLPDWVIYNLPDGLWFFSLSNCFAIIWKNKRQFLFWSMLCLLLAIGSEFFQKYHFIPGTYDNADIIAYTLAFYSSFTLKQTLKSIHR